MRECVLVEGRHVKDENIRIKFLKSGFVSEEFCPTLSDYIRLRYTSKSSETGGFVLHEQKVYANHEFSAKEKMMNGSALTRNESDKEKQKWVGKELLLFCCVAWRKKEGDEMKFVYFKECLPSPDAAGDALRRVCLRWETAEGGENEADVDTSEEENNCTAAKGCSGVFHF